MVQGDRRSRHAPGKTYGLLYPARLPPAMTTPTEGVIQCNTCGTTFPANDKDEAANHTGHDLVHIEQG